MSDWLALMMSPDDLVIREFRIPHPTSILKVPVMRHPSQWMSEESAYDDINMIAVEFELQPTESEVYQMAYNNPTVLIYRQKS